MPRTGALASFEALFEVPPQHRLVQVRARSRGGLIRGQVWEHHEYDAGGRLVARYATFEETGPDGQSAAGWRKYDPSGRLVASRDLSRSLSSLEGLSPPTHAHSHLTGQEQAR
ncbi:MAG TPA: hypothetical protein VHG30_10195 [Microvirga sp.]|nr:hypothetical protein [Microvirga sp.]